VTAWVLRLLFVLAVVWALWRLLRGMIEGFTGGGARHLKANVKLVRDPVCGVFVSPASAIPARARGETVYFCSDKCRSQWESR
jgi:YHS domain-containing protein